MTRRVVLSLMIGSTLLAGPALRAQTRDAGPAATVTLPLADFERLVDRADTARARPAGAPLAAATLAAVFDARVDDDRVRGTLALTGATWQPGAHLVPLLAGAAVLDARAGNAPLPLVAGDRGRVDGVVRGVGPFAITVDWTTDLRVAAGRATATLPSTRAGTARLRLVVPGDAADLRLTGGVVTWRTRDGATTVVEATLSPGVASDVTWRVRDSGPAALASVSTSAAANGPPRVVSDVSTLITLGDTDVRLAAVVTLAVSRGALGACTLGLPAGFRLAGISGPGVDVVQAGDRGTTVTFTTPDAPTRRLLVLLDRPLGDPGVDLRAAVVTVAEAGRERGDLAVEGIGTIAVTPAADEALRAIDARELPATLRALVQWPVLAAWRYQRTPGETAPTVGLGVVRFADADLAPAVADVARATTLVTADGRMLTGIEARISNDRQPFLKVALPPGARIVSAELDDRPVKPVSGADGLRLPLGHGQQAMSARRLSFVYVQDGPPFARKGERVLTLPVLDLPVAMYSWDLFAPDTVRLTRVGGTADDWRRFEAPAAARIPAGFAAPPPRPASSRVRVLGTAGPPGTVRGRAFDDGHNALPGVTITVRSGGVTRQLVTDAQGDFVARGVPAGDLRIEAALAGFSTATATLPFDGAAIAVDLTLAVGHLTESITVTGMSPVEDPERERAEPPPPHVLELQQRVAGVLPIRVDVPHAGRSYAFLTPLVVGDAPTVTLRYRRR